MLDFDSIPPARVQMRTRANSVISLDGHTATAPLESHKNMFISLIIIRKNELLGLRSYFDIWVYSSLYQHSCNIWTFIIF